MSEPFLSLPPADRKEALAVAADRSGRPAHLLEKDVWVVWALQTLFSSELGEHLVFKGGTSLSKADGVIQRFSEDVDLTYDIRAIAPDLVGERAEALPTTRSEEKRWSKAVRDRLPKWVVETTQPLIQDAIAAQRLSASTRADGDKLFIDYEAASSGSGYVAPSVMLEFGARSTGEPASLRDVACDANGLIEGVSFPTATPRVMHAERTFWEKATAIHVFCVPYIRVPRPVGHTFSSFVGSRARDRQGRIDIGSALVTIPVGVQQGRRANIDHPTDVAAGHASSFA